MAIEIVPFRREVDRSEFQCGKPELDAWIARYAGQSERNDTTRTFLALEDDDTLIGYYATTACELDLDEAASAFGVGKRRYPVPAMLLARLAVSESVQGRGVGGLLLFDAMERLWKSRCLSGSRSLLWTQSTTTHLPSTDALGSPLLRTMTCTCS